MCFWKQWRLPRTRIWKLKQLGVPHDVGPFAQWSVTPSSVGTIDGGLFTPNDVSVDTAAVLHVEWTEVGVTVTDDFPITVTDETPLTTAVVVVDLVPSVPPESLSPGQQFTVDVLISAANEEILDLRQIQFDSRLSTGLTVDAVTFDFEGIDEDFLYLVDESTDIFSAIYIGLQPIPGTIIHLDETPELVVVLDVTFTGNGTLNIFGESEPFTIDESVRFQAGFELILEFSQILENVEGGLLDLAEGDVPLGIASSDPEDGAIDARQPFEPNGSNPDGWSGIELTFNGDATPIGVGDFAITSDPPGAAPDVESVTPSGSDLFLEFTGIIPVEAWTIVTHTPSNTSVRIGYLPADVSNDKLSNANDVLTLIDNLNGVIGPFPPYQTDTDRSGATNANDVLRVIDLLNGAGQYPEFLGATLPE